jgi:hypothetical protein
LHGIAGEGPPEGLCLVMVPLVNEREDPEGEILGVTEARPAEDASRQDREPELDLIAPAGVDGGVVEPKATSVTPVEILPVWAVVGIQVVPDHVNGLRRVVRSDPVHEREEVHLRAPLRDATKDVAGVHIPGGGQAARALATILELPATDLGGSGKTAWETTTKRLHPGFLIDAQDDLAGPRAPKIQVDDLPHLPGEVRVGAMDPYLVAVRPEVHVAEDPSDRTRRDGVDEIRLQERLSQAQEAPLVAMILVGNGPTRQAEDLASQDSVEPRWTPAAGAIVKPLEAMIDEAATPLADGIVGDGETSRDPSVAETLCSLEDDACPQDLTLLARRRPRDPFQPVSVLARKDDDLGLRPWHRVLEVTSSGCGRRGKKMPMDGVAPTAPPRPAVTG